MKKVMLLVVALLLVSGVIFVVLFLRQVPLEMRFAPTSSPGDCFIIPADPSESPQATTMSELAGEPRDLPFDLSGTWVLHESSSALSSVPIIGDLETITTSIQQVQIRQDRNRLSLMTRVCSLESVNDSESSRVIFPQAFVDAMVVSERQAVVEPTESGFRFRQARYTRVMGADLEDPANDPLPTDPNHPRVSDDDQDGNPGVTVRLEGLLDGEVYLVQRNWNELCGDVTSPDRVEGYLWWSSGQSVLAASSFLLRRSPASIPNPDWEKNRFQLCRVPTGSSCQDILENQEAIFAACADSEGGDISR